MMGAAWRLVLLALAFILSTCTAFHVSPTSFGRQPVGRAASLRPSATQSQHVAPFTRASRHTGASRTTTRGPSMAAGEPGSSKSAQRVAAVAAVASAATLTGSAVPAHADNFAEYFANGIVGTINGPGILAIPIVLGIGLASAIAFFIYFFSQPREYDD
ncbi:unnamed protein product [Ectocarpus sp. 4 AP-2014]